MTLRPVYVLDASVAVKWFKPEERSEEARRLIEAHIVHETVLYVPDLFYLEILNVISRIKTLEDKDKWLMFSDILGLQLEGYRLNDRDLLDKALEVVNEFNITVYDAAYVSLAEILQCPLVTDDRDLSRRLMNKFPQVILLEDLFKRSR